MTPTTDGLSGAQVQAARARLAADAPKSRQAPAPLRAFLKFLSGPLVLILLAAAVVSGFVGDRIGAGIIVGIVLVSAAFEVTQTSHSERAAAALRKQVAPVARVRRDGAWVSLSPDELVPGDLIQLGPGALVPADATLVSAEGLHVQQAALTGESLPVEKRAGEPGPAAGDPNDPCRVFVGASVTTGTATATVTAVGAATAFGEIARQLSARPPETGFERGMRELSVLILRAVIVLVVFVFLTGALLRHAPLESLLFAVALAVGLTPEFLPMILTVTLGAGAVRMARKKVIVKHLQAIENLGGMEILCSDKTGTLTTDTMRLESALDPRGADSERTATLARLNAALSGTVDNPLDAALLADAPEASAVERAVGLVPFDFERRRQSVAADLPEGRVLIVKGGPESVLSVCASVEQDGGVVPLDDAARERASAVFVGLGEKGYRALAVAVRSMPADQTRFTVDDEADMTLVGFVAFANPLRDDALETLARLKGDGVSVKILTGDNERVTGLLCRAAGMDADRIVLGPEVDALDDAALAALAAQVSVFARVSPAQKLRLVTALQTHGAVVGYLGDGINDAPSLHAADVGISVAGGVDVAREAADIILLESGLKVLHDGIREGRRAFGNVLKYLLMNLSSNFGNMLSMAAASVVLPFLPMLPTQILLNNFLYDLAQTTIPTDRVDHQQLRRPHRWDMRLIGHFMLVIGPISSAYDFLTFWALRSLFHASPALFHTGWFVESLATQTLVIFAIRTLGSPRRPRPSRPLVVSMTAAVAVALALPFSPIGRALGFVPLPPLYFGFLAAMTATYVGLVQLVKVALLKRLGMS